MLKEHVAVTLGVEAQDLHNRLKCFRQKTIDMMEWYKERAAKIRKTTPRKGKGYGQVTAFSFHVDGNLDISLPTLLSYVDSAAFQRACRMHRSGLLSEVSITT